MKAKAVVVIWNRSAIGSNWVCAEAQQAARRGTLISLLSDDVDPDDLPLPFDQYQSIRSNDHNLLIDSLKEKLNGIRTPASDQQFDQRWAGYWLLDPVLRPFSPEDANPSPVSLLHAKHSLVPFMEIQGELKNFHKWACGEFDEQSKKNSCARIVYGAAGMGKTRLLMEVCSMLSDEGWLTGFVPPNIIGKGNELFESQLRQLIVQGQNTRPILLVVDYAELRENEVKWLCDQMLLRREFGGSRSRLVIISRSMGKWWRKLFGDPDVQKLFALQDGTEDSFSPTPIDSEFGPNLRQLLFQNSVITFNSALAAAGRTPVDTPPSSDQIQRISQPNGHMRPLAIQMEALLHVFGQAPDARNVSVAQLLDRVVDLETKNWGRRVRISGDARRERRLTRAVCQTTLVTRIDEKRDVIDLVSRLGDYTLKT